jgi:hypothetical protein
MSTEVGLPKQEERKIEVRHSSGGSSDAVYAIGLIGAWVYYIGRATTGQERVKGFFKGFAWPAFVVYKLLVMLDGKPSDTP